MANFQDSRQSQFRGTLQQLFPWISNQTLDVLLASINAQVTPPFSVIASNPASLVVNVGAAIVSNPESNVNNSISFINSVLPTFTGGTVTLPSSSGGNITTSTGGSTPLTLSPGNYCAILLSLDSSGNLLTDVGTQTGSPSSVIVPTPTANTLPFAYLIAHNIAGTIQNVSQTNVYQLQGGGGAGGGSGGGAAQEVPLTIGTTSQIVTFGTPRGDTSYVVIGQLVNLTDATPQYQPLEIVSKTVNGFTVEWNSPLDTSNYLLDWVIAPGVSLQAGEFITSNGATSATISFPVAFSSTNYVVICGFDNYTDSNPQFQPLTVTDKTLSSFTVNWNSPNPDGNYNISWFVGSYQ